MSELVTSEIFRLFVNTVSPDDKYSSRNMQIFWQQLPTPLSQEENPLIRFLIAFLKYLKKKEIFWRFFIEFLKYAWNLESSDKKEEYPSVIITEIIASERDVYLSV